MDVAVNPDRYPYSYKDQKGNWTGISVKLFDLLARRAGIYYRLLDADTRDDYMDLLQNGKADLSLAFFNDLSHAEQLGYKLTDRTFRRASPGCGCAGIPRCRPSAR